MTVLQWLRRATGTGIGFLGVALWVLAGIFCFVWTLYVLFQVFGAWAILVAFLFAPVTYIASIFIVWFTTGIFPLLLLVPYVLSWVGLALSSIGGRIRGD
jgi:hypothetical protein